MGNCLSENVNPKSPKVPEESTPSGDTSDEPYLTIVPGDVENIGYLMHDTIVRNNLPQCAYLLQMGFPIDIPLKYTASIPVIATKVSMNVSNVFFYEFNGTALHVACIYRRPAVVELLMQHNANPDVVDRFGRTAVILTVTYWPRVAIMKAENRGFSDLVMTTIPKKSYKCLEILCRNGANVNKAYGEMKETPLHLASRYHVAECAKVLLKFGAKVNAADGKGRTPLHYACQRSTKRKDDFELIELLLSNGAQVDQQDNDGNSPLHLAADNGCEYFVTQLLDSGANPELLNNLGFSPLYIILNGAQTISKFHALNALLNESIFLRIFNRDHQLPALLLQPEHSSVCATLMLIATTPPSLQFICRQFIRRKIGIRNMSADTIARTSLPPALHNLLLTQNNFVVDVYGY